MQDTFVNLDWHVNCYYEDADCAKIVINRFGGGEAIEICPETAVLIRAEIDQFEESHEGYDEDASATIWFLYPNQLGKHLNSEERKAVEKAIVRMWHAVNPNRSLTARRNRGSMNVMNRIAHKRRRNGRFF